MPYIIQNLSDELYYISWSRTPNTHEAKQFVEDIRELVIATQTLIYFMSDLRKGRIIDIRVLNTLGTLTRHHNWGGSVAFTTDPISKTFVNTFRKLTINQKERNAMFDEFEDARAFLELLQPDITSGIDWEAVLDDDSPASIG